MTPTQAVEQLAARGYTEAEIGRMTGMAQASVNRIKVGAMPKWDSGQKLIKLAERIGRKRNGEGKPCKAKA